MSGPSQQNGKAVRSHFGGKDWLTRYPRDKQPAFRLDTPIAKDHWRPRSQETQLSAAHPGSAVVIDDRLLEVYAYKKSRHDPPLHLYYLIDWDDRLTPSPPELFTPEVAEQHARAVAQSRSRQHRSWALFVLAPHFSFLPLEDQRRLEKEYNYPALIACRITSAVTLSIAIAAIGWSFWAMVNPVAPSVREILPRLRMGFFILMADSGVRLFGSMAGGDPVGSVLVAGPINTWRAFREALGREQRAESGRALRNMQLHGEELSRQSDQVIRLERVDETGRNYFEIRSIVDKPHWTLNRTGVHFEGKWYIPTERHRVEVQSASEPAYRFLLEPLALGAPVVYTTEYTPGEVATLLYREQIEHKKTWAHTFAIFLGLLTPDHQHELAALYDLEPRRMIRASAIAQLVIGVVLLWWATPRVTTGMGATYLFELGVGLGLTIEGAGRLIALSKGIEKGSMLALVVRALSSPLFADKPPPGASLPNEPSNDRSPDATINLEQEDSGIDSSS